MQIEQERQRNLARIAREAEEAAQARLQDSLHDGSGSPPTITSTTSSHRPSREPLGSPSRRSSTPTLNLPRDPSGSVPPTFDDETSTTTAIAGGIRVVLRGRTGGDIKIMVKATSKLSSLLKHYGQKLGLDKDAVAKLSIEFDGERLDGEHTIGETDIEEGDCLMVMGS